MKLVPLLLSTVIFSGSCLADCAQEAKAAADTFMAEYKQHLDDRYNKRVSISTTQWIQQNKRVTDSFKKSYQQLIDDAIKEDPEMGLDFDPILAAQDYPDKGFMVDGCDTANFVTLRGKDWESFKVVVKAIKNRTGWLVDGAGIINIPASKQAPR